MNDDSIIESDKKESIISEEEQNRISDEKVAEAIRNHNEEYYDKNDESPLESDEDFKVGFFRCDPKTYNLIWKVIQELFSITNSFMKFHYFFQLKVSKHYKLLAILNYNFPIL